MRLRRKLYKMAEKENGWVNNGFENWETMTAYSSLASDRDTYLFVVDLCKDYEYAADHLRSLFKTNVGMKGVSDAINSIGEKNIKKVNFKQIAEAVFVSNSNPFKPEEEENYMFNDLIEEASKSLESKTDRYKNLPDLIMDAIKLGNEEMIKKFKEEYNELDYFFKKSKINNLRRLKKNYIDKKGGVEEISLMKKLAKVVKSDMLKRKASSELKLVNSAAGESYVLSGKEGTIGRKGTVQISKDWSTVSREHLRYYVDNGAYYIEDLNSSSGTRINGQEITPGNSYEIRVGDKISMGGVPFRVE